MSDKFRQDDLLFEMLKECKSLPVFLDEIFGFLQRRTDFYHIAIDPNSPLGLPDGLAEQIVKNTFLKWKNDAKPVIKNEEDIPVQNEEILIDDNKPKAKNPSNVRTSTCEAFNSSECYNGAVYDNYSWSQTITDVEVCAKLPQNINTKDMKILIHTDRISVRLKDDTVLVEGDLCQKCKAHDAVWSIDQNKLEIHLDKCREIWWDCLVKCEPKLDITKLDCSRPFEELPEEAQSKIEELQWNQERKRLGLPTSEEMAMQEKLKKAWNLEGSPFSGPFDPSTVVYH